MKNKIVLLSNANSIHTIQWAKYLVELDIDIHVVSQQPMSPNFPKNISVTILPYNGFIGYFLNVLPLKKILEEIKPDLINVHYASGYGTTARLVNFHPYVLSVWGSDVFEFPYRSFLHKFLLKKNLQVADVIASTSHSMAVQTKLFVSNKRSIEITPFGVDLKKFDLRKKSYKPDSEILVIGTVKTMKHVYGIDILLNALSILYKKLESQSSAICQKLQFRIVGGGEDIDELKRLTIELGIQHLTTFVGAVPHEKVPEELSKLDIYVALSRRESFGVAVIEAQAMGLPVIVSNVGGLPEVVQDGVTGFVVQSENPQQAAEMLEKLIFDVELRKSMSLKGQQFVCSYFSWQACAKKMAQVYQNTLNTFKAR